MTQSSARKKAYAKERWIEHGPMLREKQHAWREANRTRLRENHRLRRLRKRAMCLVAAARVRARRKGYEFSLDATDIALLQQQVDAGKCTLTGAMLTLHGPRSATSPSLDRIDPRKGYVSGNVRIVCHAINSALGDWGEGPLRLIVEGWLDMAPSDVP